MPYQSNYAEDISDILAGSLEKIEQSIFRFATPDDPIIATVAADGGVGIHPEKEFLEMHFYRRAAGELTAYGPTEGQQGTLEASITVPLSEGYVWLRDSGRFRIETAAETYPTVQLGLNLWASDAQQEKYGREDDPNTENVDESTMIVTREDDPDTEIDETTGLTAETRNFYTRYLTDENGQDLLPAGYYNVIINVFSSELGEHDDYYWEIDEVSAERKELRLKPIDETHLGQFEVGQFADQSIFQTDFVDVLDEITKRKELGQVAPGITSAILSSTEGLYTSIADDIITEIQRLDDVNGTATMTYINGEGLRQMVEAAIKQTFTDIMVDMKAVNRNLPKGTQDVPEKRFRMTKAFFEAAVGKVADNIITDALVASRFPDSDGEDRLFVNQ